MKIFSRKELIIGALLILAITQIYAAKTRKGQTKDTSDQQTDNESTDSDATNTKQMTKKDTGKKQMRNNQMKNNQKSKQLMNNRAMPDKKKNSKHDIIGLDELANALAAIPLIGFMCKAILNYTAKILIDTDQMTNGVLSRILGGSLPCVVSLSKGFLCSGTSRNGGVFGVFVSMINGMPSILLPHFAKSLLINSIKIFINPMMDVMFGGLPKP